LDALTDGTINRLMVLAPPRHGKSELASRRFPAYYLGRFPDNEVMQLTYAADLASAMNRDVQRIIDSPTYGRVFPGTRLAAKGAHHQQHRAKRTDDLFEVVGRKGRLRSTGILGGITGMGFHLGVADDLYKNAEEALSITIRQKVMEEWRSSFLTRQYPDAAILLIGTHWHHDDIYGVLSREEDWEILTFPALSEGRLHVDDERTEDGLALWPERFNADWLAKIKRDVGSLWWNALYQQHPIPEGGNYFTRKSFGRYKDAGDYWILADRPGAIHKSSCTVLGSVDPAASEKQSADYTAMLAGALTPLGDLLLLESEKERMTPDKIPPAMLRFARRHGIEFYTFEDSGFQIAVVLEARKLNGMPPIREVAPRGKGKVVRATPAMVKAEAGQVYVPDPSPPWLDNWFDVLERFRGEDEENDVVDAFADMVRQCPRLTAEKSTMDEDEVMERLSLRDREATSTRHGMWGRR
jgi:predicted phage terminase large subunit-like protein